MYKQAFKTHPYRWPVIGWMKDIKAVTPEKAVAFYRRFYAPDNAVVVVAGRFDEAAALALVAEAYGALPASTGARARRRRRPSARPPPRCAPTSGGPVPADRVGIGFPAPALGDADRAAFEILARSSRAGRRRACSAARGREGDGVVGARRHRAHEATRACTRCGCS